MQFIRRKEARLSQKNRAMLYDTSFKILSTAAQQYEKNRV